jgi:hypothetical protein
MTQMQILLDPSAETGPISQPRIPRVSTLKGLTIGLLDIAKMRGDEFLDRIDERLTEQGYEVKRYRKRVFMERASTELKQQIRSECQVVIEGLAD